MSDENSDDPGYKVGYGKPPLQSRFQKGKSGNPRGRTPKIEPSRTKRQQQMDFLAVAEEPVKITINGKTRAIPAFQAVVWKLQQKAMSGDGKAMALYFGMATELMDGFNTANPQVAGMVDDLHRARMSQPDALKPEDIGTLNRFHRMTRTK